MVSNGLLGQKNDIIVDDAKNPNNFGVCDGKGDFINISKKKKTSITNDLCKLTKKIISFN